MYPVLSVVEHPEGLGETLVCEACVKPSTPLDDRKPVGPGNMAHATAQEHMKSMSYCETMKIPTDAVTMVTIQIFFNSIVIAATIQHEGGRWVMGPGNIRMMDHLRWMPNNYPATLAENGAESNLYNGNPISNFKPTHYQRLWHVDNSAYRVLSGTASEHATGRASLPVKPAPSPPPDFSKRPPLREPPTLAEPHPTAWSLLDDTTSEAVVEPSGSATGPGGSQNDVQMKTEDAEVKTEYLEYTDNVPLGAAIEESLPKDWKMFDIQQLKGLLESLAKTYREHTMVYQVYRVVFEFRRTLIDRMDPSERVAAVKNELENVGATGVPEPSGSDTALSSPSTDEFMREMQEKAGQARKEWLDGTQWILDEVGYAKDLQMLQKRLNTKAQEALNQAKEDDKKSYDPKKCLWDSKVNS